MGYICKEIKNKTDRFRCKNKNQRYNQCCQDCLERNTCNNHCDYAHCFNCMAKEEIKD